MYKNGSIIFNSQTPPAVESNNKLQSNHHTEYYTPMKINHSSMPNIYESQHTAEGKKQDTQKQKHIV